MLTLAPINSSNDFFAISNNVDSALKSVDKTHISPETLSADILSPRYTFNIRQYLKTHPQAIGKPFTVKLLLSSSADLYLKHNKVAGNTLSPEVKTYLDYASKHKVIVTAFNSLFFTQSDSRYPELAGIRGALEGSLTIIVLTMLLATLIGVSTAIFIEEFVKKSTLKSALEININNLSAIPSIIFGLLGLSLLQNLLGLPRSSALIASLVLTLMVVPTVIVYSQLALKNVSNTIKEAAYGIGASKNQVIFTHVLPAAMPGIITGIIIALSRSLGETAPLLIIGMFAFVPSTSFSLTSTTTSLPTQILLWFNMPEAGFIEKTSAAIMVLLTITITINILANYIRKKFI